MSSSLWLFAWSSKNCIYCVDLMRRPSAKTCAGGVGVKKSKHFLLPRGACGPLFRSGSRRNCRADKSGQNPAPYRWLFPAPASGRPAVRHPQVPQTRSFEHASRAVHRSLLLSADAFVRQEPMCPHRRSRQHHMRITSTQTAGTGPDPRAAHGQTAWTVRRGSSRWEFSLSKTGAEQSRAFWPATAQEPFGALSR